MITIKKMTGIEDMPIDYELLPWMRYALYIMGVGMVTVVGVFYWHLKSEITKQDEQIKGMLALDDLKLENQKLSTELLKERTSEIDKLKFNLEIATESQGLAKQLLIHIENLKT